MDNIKVSVIVPVFNNSEYIGTTLDSIIAQDFDGFEIIVIDDGSTDNSNLILEKYNKQIDNLTVFHQNNSGVSVARNRDWNLRKVRIYGLWMPMILHQKMQ